MRLGSGEAHRPVLSYPDSSNLSLLSKITVKSTYRRLANKGSLHRFFNVLVLHSVVACALACPNLTHAQDSNSAKSVLEKPPASKAKQSDSLQGRVPQKISKGKRCLFIGHSFFIPVANSFSKKVSQAGIQSHTQQSVFAGGANGSPGRLWKNERKRSEILKILDTGKVELLGMTYFSPNNSSLDDYRKWIDYALKKNKKTTFFIGLPWGLNGPSSSLAAFAATSTLGQAVVYQGTVLKLRELYPDNRFYWANYGRVAVELKRKFEKGQLSGLKSMISRSGKNAIFRDKMGHAASKTLEMAALVWLAVLYNVDLAGKDWGLGEDKQLIEIVKTISQQEQAFNRN
ncbi:MAG: hypothetical protein VX438_06025 [Planctomycetota bacterium]|nr:hypothetical protein [Planctomycetota bacterium]